MARDTAKRNAAAQAKLAARGIHVPAKGAENAWRKVRGADRGLSGQQSRGHAPAGRGIQELRRAGVHIPGAGPRRTKEVPTPPRGAGAPHPVGPLAPLSEAPEGTHGTYQDAGPMSLREALNTVTGDDTLRKLAQMGMVHIIRVFDEYGDEYYEIVVDDVTPAGGAA